MKTFAHSEPYSSSRARLWIVGLGITRNAKFDIRNLRKRKKKRNTKSNFFFSFLESFFWKVSRFFFDHTPLLRYFSINILENSLESLNLEFGRRHGWFLWTIIHFFHVVKHVGPVFWERPTWGVVGIFTTLVRDVRSQGNSLGLQTLARRMK